MTTFGEYYRTGTVALTANGLTVTGTGVAWSDIVQGDILESQGRQATIDSVSGAGLDTITLMLPWAGTTASGVAYVIRKDAKARFDPALTQSKLREFLNAISSATTLDLISLHGSDIASAATVNLEAATGDLVDVTGTTTITAITLADGHKRTVRFTGALVLTHSSSLLLPGLANITTAAGDFAIFRGYAGGVVRCVDYVPASGGPLRGQIPFPATQNASSNANTLDDYEEGTWTPTLTGTFVAGTFTYAVREGYYVKIGQLVFVSFSVVLSAISVSPTGSFMQITGFPFVASAAVRQGAQANDWSGYTNSKVRVGIQLQGAVTFGYVTYINAAAASEGILTPAEITAASAISVSFCYRAGA